MLVQRVTKLIAAHTLSKDCLPDPMPFRDGPATLWTAKVESVPRSLSAIKIAHMRSAVRLNIVVKDARGIGDDER